ncbi:hypothetical protein [Tenacibaculum sp.]|uniref:hypothetical protein n=1 Tax=Tenacibaculum sp. TaxID=1906242 RepID=UPI003D105258
MATCKVQKVWAPNGKESKLFLDLKKRLKSESEALKAWTMVYSNDFRKVFGDWRSEDFEGELDENGEPKMLQVIKEEYFKDADAIIKAEKDAQRYVQSSEKLEEYKSSMHDVLVRKIAQLERSSGKGGKIMQTNLKRLKNNLKSLNWMSATRKFTATAAKNIHFAKIRLDSELGKKEPNSALLSRYNNYLQAFDTLNELVAEIQGNPIMAETMKEDLKLINELIGEKEGAKRRYKNYMEGVVADKFASVTNKYDREAIQKMLKEAPFDIKGREKLLLYAGDASDKIIQLMAKVINEQQQKTRQASIEFSRVLADKVDAVEKERSQYKSNPEKLYEPILEKDSNGNLTGRIIHPNHNKAAYDAFVAANGGTALHDFLEFWIKEYGRLNDMLPMSYRMGSKLPTVMKKGWEKVFTSENKLEQIRESSRKLFEATNTDIATGEMTDDAGNVIHQVPIHFTQPYDSAVFNRKRKELLKEGVGESAATKQATEFAIAELPKHLSFDLGSSLQVFQHMAENYSNMSEIADIADTTKEFLGERDVLKTTSMGENIISKMKGLENKNISIKGTESKAYQLIESLIETQIYGITEKELGSTSFLGMEFDHRKLLKLISKYNSMNMIGGNVLAASSNILMGETMQWAEAFGGEYYSKKSYLKAGMEYSKNIPSIAADAIERTPKNKVNLINQWYDVLGDYHPDGAGASDKSIIRKSINSGALFFLNSAGEHMMQSKAMIATMMSTEVFDSEGKSLGNLYDTHEVKDGKLEFKDLYIKKGKDLIKYDAAQQRELSRKVQYILRKMHGNYNRQTAAEWQRNAVYGLIGQFRKWISDGVDRRFKKGDWSEFAEKDVEGNYRSTWKFMKALSSDLKQFNFDISSSWNELTEVQKANVRKTAFEAGVFTATIAGLSLLAVAASGLDDEKDKGKLQALRYSMYITNRLNTELMFFINPMDTWQILKSPAAAMSVTQQVAQTLYYALPWNWDEQYEAGINKDKNKLLHNAIKLVPLWKQLERITPDGIKGQLQYYNIN